MRRGVVMAAGLVMTAGTGGASPVTALACLPQTPAVAILCEELREAIATARPDLPLVPVAEDALATHAQALRLRVVTLRDDGIVARLDWRPLGQGWRQGPEMSVVSLDSPLSQPMIHQFLLSLWTQGPAGL